jgi:hypothetical protein
MPQSHHRRHHLFQEFQDQEIIHLHRPKEWVFLVRWQDLETILLTQLKEWQGQERKDLEVQDLDQDPKVHRHDLEQDLPVPVAHAQDLAEQNQDSEAELQVEHSHLGDQPAVADAALVVELLEHSVRVALAEAVKLASLSAPREKNSNKEVFQALVAQLYRAVMEPQLFVCAAVHRSKISRTRLMPMPVS